MFELSSSITQILKVFGLFFITAIAEILGCYFPYLILNQGRSYWLWIPTALSLAIQPGLDQPLDDGNHRAFVSEVLPIGVRKTHCGRPGEPRFPRRWSVLPILRLR